MQSRLEVSLLIHETLLSSACHHFPVLQAIPLRNKITKENMNSQIGKQSIEKFWGPKANTNIQYIAFLLCQQISSKVFKTFDFLFNSFRRICNQNIFESRVWVLAFYHDKRKLDEGVFYGKSSTVSSFVCIGHDIVLHLHTNYESLVWQKVYYMFINGRTNNTTVCY